MTNLNSHDGNICSGPCFFIPSEEHAFVFAESLKQIRLVETTMELWNYLILCLTLGNYLSWEFA